MDFLFISRGCRTCQAAMSALENYQKTNSWTGDVKIVDVKFDTETRTFRTYVDGEDAGESPVSTVPAYFSPEKEILWQGIADVLKGLENGCK